MLSLLFKLLQLFLKLWELAVFQLCRLVEVVLTLCLFYLAACALYLLTELLNSGNIVLFVLPLCLHALELLAKLCKLFLNFLKVLL